MLKLKEVMSEGWWDNMSDAAKKAYIKKHGEAPNVAGDDEPKVPAPDSKSDKGKPRVSANPYDDNYGQEVDDEDDYDMGEVPGSRGTGPWTPEDDPDFEHGPSLTSAPGRVPDEDEYPDKDPINTKKGEMEDEMEDIANELDNVTDPDEKKELEDRYDKIDQELYDINKKQYGDDSGYEMSPADDEEPDYSPGHPDTMDDDELKQFLDKDAEEDEGEPYKREPFQPGDDPEELSVGAAQDELEKAQAEMAHAEEMGDKAAYADAEEKEYALQVRLGIAGRTGNELNQETLMIDGKQFRRISEGVKKQPKPKYEFSEFYKRFKR